jgi:dihydropyrimidinase
MIVQPAGIGVGDLLMCDGVISEIAPRVEAPDAEVVAVSGRYVIPGAVDPHTHLNTVFRGQRTRDDFRSGTEAALVGGTTCIIDFCLQRPGARVAETFERWVLELAEQGPLTDVGVHFAVTDLTPPNALQEVGELMQRGVTSIKTYMAYPGRMMLEDADQARVMRVAAEAGACVLVHAEDGHEIERLVAAALAQGHVGARWHARTRPPTTEAAAIRRIAGVARRAGARLYIVHISSAEGVQALIDARHGGARVTGETCPQYLLLDETSLDQPMSEAVKYVFTPPPRTEADRERLWRALRDGDLAVVASDHCPFDAGGQKLPEPDGDFTTVLNGVPGIEHRLTLLYSVGVRGGRLSVERWVELCATAPARQFGLAGRKGALTLGADADVVVFNPELEWTLSVAGQRSRVDYTPYEGMHMKGAPERVYTRGRLAVRDGEVVAAARSGRFLRRDAGGPDA